MIGPPARPRALLFDMDGTLTEPMLDFPRIKAEMGIGDRPILEALAEMDARRRDAAEAVLLRHEQHAAEHSTLNPGCRELLDWLEANSIQSALITRNSRASAQTVLARHRLSFEAMVTREDPPYKPNPYPLRLACQRLGLKEPDVWMVGDGVFDVQAGIAAGIRTVWVTQGRSREFAAKPWKEVHGLVDLHQLLRECA
jgi:HAD superfamily hydrolase (TIGR01549 family)